MTILAIPLRQKLAECAAKNTPLNVRFVQIRKSLTGRAWCDPKHPEYGKMAAPRPLTRKALYIYLHECAHFALHSHRRGKVYIQEMEAEKWAHQKMREAGIAVPRVMTLRAQIYVRHKVRKARARGLRKLDREVAQYIR